MKSFEVRYYDFDGFERVVIVKAVCSEDVQEKLSDVDPLWDDITYIFDTEEGKLC